MTYIVSYFSEGYCLEILRGNEVATAIFSSRYRVVRKGVGRGGGGGGGRRGEGGGGCEECG